MFDTTLDGFVGNVSERNRFGVSLPVIFAIGIYALLITHAQVMLRDPDTFWHIVVGRWIIEYGTVPDHGIFSGTMAHAPWLDQEWLAEILMAWGYDHFGWAALAVGTALSVAVAIAILLRALLGTLPPVYAMIAIVLAGALWSPHILARPFILTTPILVVWVAGLVRARRENRPPSLWMALLIVVWTNLHGSFVFGIGIAALLAAEAVLRAPDWAGRIRSARDWGRFGAVALGAALITPYGYHGLLFPIHLANMSSLAYIGEWQGMNFSQTWALPMTAWLLTILFAGLTLGWRLPPARVGMLLLLLMMALKHIRYMDLLGSVSALLLAPSLALRLNRRGATRIDRLMDELARPANWRSIMASSVMILALSIIVLRVENPQPADEISPVAAVTEVKANHIDGPVFNSDLFGGYLIFAGIEPFVDGRAELYGDDYVKRYVDASWLTNGQLPELLNDSGIAWTIFPPNGPAATLMDHLPGWRRLYVDSVAIVHVRQPS